LKRHMLIVRRKMASGRQSPPMWEMGRRAAPLPVMLSGPGMGEVRIGRRGNRPCRQISAKGNSRPFSRRTGPTSRLDSLPHRTNKRGKVHCPNNAKPAQSSVEPIMQKDAAHRPKAKPPAGLFQRSHRRTHQEVLMSPGPGTRPARMAGTAKNYRHRKTHPRGRPKQNGM